MPAPPKDVRGAKPVGDDACDLSVPRAMPSAREALRESAPANDFLGASSLCGEGSGEGQWSLEGDGVECCAAKVHESWHVVVWEVTTHTSPWPTRETQP